MYYDFTYFLHKKIYIYILVSVALYVVCSPSQQVFIHRETSSLPLSDCRVKPMFGAYGHWAVRVLTCVTPTASWESYLKVISEIPWHPHLLPGVRQWNWDYLSLHVLGLLSWPEIEHLTYCMRGKRSNRLQQHRGMIMKHDMKS